MTDMINTIYKLINFVSIFAQHVDLTEKTTIYKQANSTHLNALHDVIVHGHGHLVDVVLGLVVHHGVGEHEHQVSSELESRSNLARLHLTLDRRQVDRPAHIRHNSPVMTSLQLHRDVTLHAYWLTHVTTTRSAAKLRKTTETAFHNTRPWRHGFGSSAHVNTKRHDVNVPVDATLGFLYKCTSQ